MSTYAPRALPRAFSSDLARQSLAGLAVAAVAGATTVYVTSHLRLSVVAAVGMAAISLWLATTRRTQLALAVVMLYLGLLDGFLKLESNSNLVTFVRDGLLYAVVIGLLVRASVRRERLPLPPLSGLLIAFIVLVFLQFANPNAGTLFHSLAGVRQHLEFMPLFFLTYAFVRTTKALRWFVILLAVIAAANGIAGYVQLRESPQQFAAWGPGYAQRVLGTGAFAGAGRTFATSSIPGQTGGTRPFGLGSDSGDGGLFGVLAFCGILALAAFSTRRRDQLFAIAMALGAVLAIISSQNRGVIASGVIILLAFGVLTAASRTRLRSLLGLALAAVASVLVIQAIIGSVGSSELRYGGLGPSSILQTTSQARGKSIALIPHNLATYPFGAGLATAGPAAGSVAGASELSLSGNVNTETEFSFLTVETGIAGMLVFTGFIVTLLVLGLRRVREEPDREARVLLAAIIAPVAGIFALFFTSDPTVSVPTGPYLWAVGGIVAYWLVALPAARRGKSKTACEAENAPTP